MNVKKILIIIMTVLFLASVPLAIYLVKQRQEIRMRAAPASTLSLTPSTLTTSVGESFTLEAMIETETNIVPAVEIHLTFDPAVFQATSLAAGDALADIYDGPEINNDSGTAFIVVGDVQNPVEGIGVVATIGFQVIGSSNEIEEIAFADSTQAGAWQEEGVNVLVGINSSMVVVLSEEQPTPTVTPIATATPTTPPAVTGTVVPTATIVPVATATPVPGLGSAATATPVPTSLPTSTPTIAIGATVTPTVSAEPTPTPPVTGISGPTLVFLGMGLILLLGGFFAFL